MPEMNNTLNPQVEEVEIGKLNLRKIKLLPLSLKDQIEVTDVIKSALNVFFSSDQAESEEAMFGMLLDLISSNLETVLEKVLEESEDASEVIGQITNVQALSISKKIYEVNYKDAVKNVQSLLGANQPEEIPEQLPSRRPSQQSVKDTQGTDLKTSTENRTPRAARH